MYGKLINFYKKNTIVYTTTPPLYTHLDINYSLIVPVGTVKACGAMDV